MSRPEGTPLCNGCASHEQENTIVTRGSHSIPCEECGTPTRERTIGVSYSPPPRMRGLELTTGQLATAAAVVSGSAILGSFVVIAWLVGLL